MTSSCLRIGFRNGYSLCASGFRISQAKPSNVVQVKKDSNDQFQRNMASGRNHFVSKASKKSGITEEVRDLIRNVKHAENIDEWNKEAGIGEPIKVKAWRPNWDEDIDDDQHFDMHYYPHKGEENTGLWAERNKEGYEPPIVLLVERTKNLKGQPWYHKEILERLGLGYNTYKGKQVAVPNMSFYTSKLYQVKHSIKITPITFPDGLPPREDFDPQMAKLTVDGKFLYHPKIKEANLKIESGNAPDRLKIKESTYKQDCHKHWVNPYDSPFGNSNYSRDTTVCRPEKKDFKSDYTVKDAH